MIISQLAQDENLTCECVSASVRGEEVEGIIVSELMSDVLTLECDNLLLISGLCTDQVIRTADIVGAVAIIISSDKKVPDSMKSLAEEADIALFSTSMRNFALCQHLLENYPECKDGEA